ncbi:hypothetical protein TSL6_04480 [Sulfurovum sp. TSL6]|uniref:HNH endonuclease n=1 Tax=Sulfurovum sp. TSL6 TaxID=2826995 RepID=UPI001CC6F4E0|nr:HNH endonuclease [Sulfurovum sp. TSL6]GIT99941.1 hypothetical protein TSL6_04480 [Sulfurovum sp. TSL6]
MQNSKTFGTCATCSRHTALTKHHLIPKKRHKKIKNNSSDVSLDAVIYVCRTCHDGVHDLYDERTLSKEYNTLEKICADERLRKHFMWVSKCKKGVQ